MEVKGWRLFQYPLFESQREGDKRSGAKRGKPFSTRRREGRFTNRTLTKAARVRHPKNQDKAWPTRQVPSKSLDLVVDSAARRKSYVEIQRGVQLGALHQTLGISAESRVCFQLTPTGVVIWDLGTGTRHMVDGRVITKEAFTVPARVTAIIKASTEDLKRQWEESEGFDEDRETIFAELTARGVDLRPGARQISPKVPPPHQNTPEAKAYMRQVFPMLVELMKTRVAQEQLAMQEKIIDWDAINAIERECGLPESPCPEGAFVRYSGRRN